MHWNMTTVTRIQEVVVQTNVERNRDLAKLNNSIQSSQYSIATTRRKYITTVSEIRILLSVSVELIRVVNSIFLVVYEIYY